MASVTFQPEGVTVECIDGEAVFFVAARAGVGIATACGAKATCGLCRVRIASGEQFTSPQNDDERKHLGNVYFITKVRLSCQTRVEGGDVTVQIVGMPEKKKKP